MHAGDLRSLREAEDLDLIQTEAAPFQVTLPCGGRELQCTGRCLCRSEIGSLHVR